MTVQPGHEPSVGHGHEPAVQPNDLGRFFLDRANAGDVEGLVALYEPGAVLAVPPGGLATGHEQIREVYARLLADRPSSGSAGQPPAILNGDLALTSTRLPGGGATVEVARRQADGTRRWVIDQPALLARSDPARSDPARSDHGNGSRSGSTQPPRAGSAARVVER